MSQPPHVQNQGYPQPASESAARTRIRATIASEERRLWSIVALLGLALVAGALWKRIFITVPAGHHGVMFYRFGAGTVTTQIWGEGLYVIAPWNKLTPYETRLQARTVHLAVPSLEGLEMGVSVSLRYRPYVDSLGYLHQDLGPDYFERLILPELHIHLRRIFGRRGAQEIYTGDQELFTEVARMPLLSRLPRRAESGAEPGPSPSAQPYILLEELRILDIERPKVVADAVSEKQRQEQLSLEYKHRLQREQQEAERKRTEAAGIRDYNRIAGQINPEVLRWRNVEATLEIARANVEATRELAKSTNAKVVVLGGGQGAMPMMLNLGDGSVPREPSPAAADGSAQAQSASGKGLPLVKK